AEGRARRRGRRGPRGTRRGLAGLASGIAPPHREARAHLARRRRQRRLRLPVRPQRPPRRGVGRPEGEQLLVDDPGGRPALRRPARPGAALAVPVRGGHSAAVPPRPRRDAAGPVPEQRLPGPGGRGRARRRAPPRRRDVACRDRLDRRRRAALRRARAARAPVRLRPVAAARRLDPRGRDPRGAAVRRDRRDGPRPAALGGAAARRAAPPADADRRAVPHARAHRARRRELRARGCLAARPPPRRRRDRPDGDLLGAARRQHLAADARLPPRPVAARRPPGLDRGRSVARDPIVARLGRRVRGGRAGRAEGLRDRQVGRAVVRDRPARRQLLPVPGGGGGGAGPPPPLGRNRGPSRRCPARGSRESYAAASAGSSRTGSCSRAPRAARRTGISVAEATAPIAASTAPTISALCSPPTNASAEPWPRAAEPGISAPKSATPTAIPAWRNVSFTPAARPLCSAGAELSATALTAGLNRPVPIPATTSIGTSIAHDDVASASRPSASPTATSASPTAIIAPAE